MSREVFRLDDISVVRDGNIILDKVSLKLEKGEHLAIVGSNGAGKSFLMRILSADMIPSSGAVTVLGETFGKTSLWSLRERIGFVSSRMQYWFPQKFSIREVVSTGLSGTYGSFDPLSNPENNKVDALLGQFSLLDISNRSFEVLSDGERRKCLLARAMTNCPELLIFDEPCQGLDLPSRARFKGEVAKLAAQIPIVYVSHQLEEIPACITNAAILNAGRIVALGAKEDVFSNEILSGAYDYPIQVVKSGEDYLMLPGS